VSSAARGRRAAARAASLLLLLAAACGGDDGGGDRSGTPDPSSTTTTGAGATDGGAAAAPDLEQVDLRLEAIADLGTPLTAMAARPGTDDLYVAEQAGRVRRIQVTRRDDGTRREQLVDEPALDLTDRIASGGERGLLGLAFSSDGRTLYLYGTLQPSGDNWLGEVELGEGLDASSADVRTLLQLPDEFPNHNGGQLALGPDGFLYLGLGDGGSGGDPRDRAQDPGDLFGSILRIDPEGGTATVPYAVPEDNPFLGTTARPETWLYGVRNPWRFSFDRATGDLWVADVGQGEWEEVDRLAAVDGRDAGRGANLGWNRMEGSHPYEGGTNPPGGVLPVLEYDHGDGGCAVVGGYVYRGTAIPDLVGAYLYTDYCQRGVRAIALGADGTVAQRRTFDLRLEQVQSFGEDADGEVCALTAAGEVLRLESGA
jgi:glucose/arabinose dehydrogenase